MKALVFPVFSEVSGISGPPQGQWTRTDWENLPDDGNRYEVIEGVLYMSTAPSWFHQWIIKRFFVLVGLPAEELALAVVAMAPIGVFMPGCEPVQPDFVVVLIDRISMIHDKRIWGVPDLIMEVLSPSNADYNEDVKLTAYAKAGVPEYVVVDPNQRQVRLYQLEKSGQYAPPQTFKVGDMMTLKCLPTISVPIAKLFEGSPDTTL